MAGERRRRTPVRCAIPITARTRPRFCARLAALVVAAGLVLTACSQPTAGTARATTSVGVYTVRTQPYTVTMTLPGRTSAYMTSAVRPQVDGIIRKRLFTEGADVHAGQVLYQIDPSRYQAAYDSAKAALAQAQAAVQSARPRAERYQALARIDAIAKQDRDDAVATLAQSKADVATARADLETARINLGYTRIKAPISGRIGASSYTPGALLTTNQATPLATIQQFDPIYVDIKQTSTQYLTLKRALASGRLQSVSDDAARVRVSVLGDNGATLAGKLEFTGVSVDPGTGTVNLRAVVPNPDALLLPGMYVQARLAQGVDVNAILVPQQAVNRTDNGQAFCLVVKADNTVARRSLEIAAADGNRWRVSQGLASGDRVIVQGLGKVSAGDTVKPVTVDGNSHLKSLRMSDDVAQPDASGA